MMKTCRFALFIIIATTVLINKKVVFGFSISICSSLDTQQHQSNCTNICQRWETDTEQIITETLEDIQVRHN
jgi:hypothetical protein